MTQTQLLRVIRLLMMFSVLVVLLLGRGYQLEMDTRSGQMRRIETLLGMRVWRGSAEESLYSAEIHPDKLREPNWIRVAERAAFAGGVTDCFCIYDLSHFLYSWEMQIARDMNRGVEPQLAAWRFAVKAAVKVLEQGDDVCDVARQTRAFGERFQSGHWQEVLKTEADFRRGWLAAAAGTRR